MPEGLSPWPLVRPLLILALLACGLCQGQGLRRPVRASQKQRLLAFGPGSLARGGGRGAGIQPFFLESPQLSGLRWRELGPMNMGGRITSLAVVEEDPRIFYVGAASGGVWKTTNAGGRFRPIFEHQGVGSIGAVAVAPGHPLIVWVGTGEANARNSCSPGKGVYKSVDGGQSWHHMGLLESRHIGRVVIDPRDPQVVFVAALGHLFGPNRERGLFRTRDGGRSFELLLQPDAETGVVDVCLDPQHPDTVYAATYTVRRNAFERSDPVVRVAPTAGIFRSRDGGDTWVRLRQGLPQVACGRIGLALCRADPRVLYAVVETELSGQGLAGSQKGRAYLGVRGRDAGGGRGAFLQRVVEGTGASRAGLQPGDVIFELGKSKVGSWRDLVAAIHACQPQEAVVLGVWRQGKQLRLPLTLGVRGFGSVMGGQQPNQQDRQGPRGFETGGIFQSVDGGDHWRRVNSLLERPFYFGQVRVDPEDQRQIWVPGIRLYHSANGGQSFLPVGQRDLHPDQHALWIDPRDGRHLILGGDGGLFVSWDRGQSFEHLRTLPIAQYYAVCVDDARPYHIYGGLQDNGTWGIPSRTRDRGGLSVDHAFRLSGGDGFVCRVPPGRDKIVYFESQNGHISRLDLSTGAKTRVWRPRGDRGAALRWNWRTPFLISPHHPATLFYGANKLLRSRDQGRSGRLFPAELTLTERGTLTALAVSPFNEDLIWGGSDDGGLFRSRDGGQSYQELHRRLPGVGGERYVAHIELSTHERGKLFVVLDGHRSDDPRPLIFKSRDGGRHWKSVTAGLPQVSCRVLKEDPLRPDLLWLGTECGLWVSLDGGAQWVSFGSALPDVSVHDLVIQRRAREVVVATHGRGLWVADAAALEALTPEVIGAKAALLPIKEATAWIQSNARLRLGIRRRAAQNPPPGALISYWLRDPRQAGVTLLVHNLMGRLVARLRGGGRRGLNQVTWNLQSGPGGRHHELGPGTYRITLVAGEIQVAAPLKVVPDPLLKREAL